jgi:enamine deaminase RidA (YjgF/YER057c/UK114 family)
MHKFEEVYTPEVWKPAGRRYSQALKVQADSLLFISGLIARDQAGEMHHRGDVEGQARMIFETLRAVLRAAGGDFRNVVSMRFYFKDAKDLRRVLKIRDELFIEPPFPAVTTLVTELADTDVLFEIEATAAL